MVNMRYGSSNLPHLIAVDWGTSSLRAWLLDGRGQALDARSSRHGIMQVPAGDFASVYQELIGDWIEAHGPLPAIACGMIGSRGGWLEAPYARCPANPDSLAEHLSLIDADPVPLQVVPGVMQPSSDGVLPDVMRGEETQVLGALADEPALADNALLVLPGTHCKWISVRDGRLAGFTTYMTGELFAVLREHSILGRPSQDVDTVDSEQAFDLGVASARQSGAASASAALFSVRSRVLADELTPAESLSYLSGLLIGEELRSVLATRNDRPPLRLIGDDDLCARYRRAMTQFEITDASVIEDAACHGLWRIANSAGLVDS